ncbi:MAG: hypothetical protein VYA84_09990, partial [Planctomycetota bacterium]|nr:hypothetical protein [Planctomycetota bacterium]
YAINCPPALAYKTRKARDQGPHPKPGFQIGTGFKIRIQPATSTQAAVRPLTVDQDQVYLRIEIAITALA